MHSVARSMRLVQRNALYVAHSTRRDLCGLFYAPRQTRRGLRYATRYTRWWSARCAIGGAIYPMCYTDHGRRDALYAAQSTRRAIRGTVDATRYTRRGLRDALYAVGSTRCRIRRTIHATPYTRRGFSLRSTTAVALCHFLQFFINFLKIF